jgi:hypothetical protein
MKNRFKEKIKGWSVFEAEVRLNTACTSKRTPHFAITKINLLTLFKEIIPVYTENRMKPTIENASSLTGKADGSHNYLSALKG